YFLAQPRTRLLLRNLTKFRSIVTAARPFLDRAGSQPLATAKLCRSLSRRLGSAARSQWEFSGGVSVGESFESGKNSWLSQVAKVFGVQHQHGAPRHCYRIEPHEFRLAMQLASRFR